LIVFFPRIPYALITWVRQNNDVETSGDWIEMEHSSPRGSEIWFSMLERHADSETGLQCGGAVIRAERYNGGWRIAVAFEAIGFNVWLRRKFKKRASDPPQPAPPGIAQA